MYALLLPSAHSFISSVEEKVKVDVRQMFGPTGAPTPWRFGSPAWTERVCGPHFSVLELFMVLELLAFTAIPGKHHFGATRRGARSRCRRADQREACAWRLLFPPARWARSRSGKIPWCTLRDPVSLRLGRWRR